VDEFLEMLRTGEFTFEDFYLYVGRQRHEFDVANELVNLVHKNELKQFVRVENVGDFDSMLDLPDETNLDNTRIMYVVNYREI